VSNKILITVVARGDELMRGGGPAGFGLAGQVFSESGLEDAAEVARPGFWQKLRILERAIAREFGNQVKLRIINPWSLEGLWYCTRRRIRQFPCMVIADQPLPLDTPQREIIEIIEQALSRD
jgi:hypothetical protein